MASRASKTAEQVTLRVLKKELARADKLVEHVATPGTEATRNDVLREAISLGLDAIEKRAARAKKH